MRKVKGIPNRKSLAERLRKALAEGIDFTRGEKKLRTNKRTRDNDNGKPSS